MNQKVTRRRFTKQFKKDAVNLVLENGYGCAEVARRLGVNENNVNRWVRDFRDQQQDRSEGTGSPEQMETELRRLRKENQRLLMEREILKKAAAFFAKESS